MPTINERAQTKINVIEGHIEACQFELEFNKKILKDKEASDGKKKEANRRIKFFEDKIADHKLDLKVAQSMKEKD